MDTKAFIDGGFIAPDDTYDNIDPASGEVIGSTANCGPDEVDAAIAAARLVQAKWSERSVSERADIMQRYAGLILDSAEELAMIESEDTGKPLSQARADAEVTARYFNYYGRAIESYYGLQIPVDPNLLTYTIREPLGVCGSIVAWNYPMQLFGRAVAPAVVTGNTVVLKPADETPRTAVRLAEIATEAGFPSGVINVVPGVGSQTGAYLAQHEGIDHIGFVGSNPVGVLIAESAAKNVVPATLELGGKSPHIVFPDANIADVITYVTKGILQNAGQTCSAGSRLLVHTDVADEVHERLRAAFQEATIGPGTSDRDLGPLISVKQQGRVQSLVEDSSGLVLSGGEVPPDLKEGAYFQPTLIADVDPTSIIAQEEVFGPVLVTTRFETEAEAIEVANGTKYALMAAVWTSDISRAHRLATKILAGQVYVNAYGAGGGVEFPFGGFKKSGYGREKGYESLDTYTATKTVIVRV